MITRTECVSGVDVGAFSTILSGRGRGKGASGKATTQIWGTIPLSHFLSRSGCAVCPPSDTMCRERREKYRLHLVGQWSINICISGGKSNRQMGEGGEGDRHCAPRESPAKVWGISAGHPSFGP